MVTNNEASNKQALISCDINFTLNILLLIIVEVILIKYIRFEEPVIFVIILLIRIFIKKFSQNLIAAFVILVNAIVLCLVIQTYYYINHTSQPQWLWIISLLVILNTTSTFGYILNIKARQFATSLFVLYAIERVVWSQSKDLTNDEQRLKMQIFLVFFLFILNFDSIYYYAGSVRNRTKISKNISQTQLNASIEIQIQELGQEKEVLTIVKNNENEMDSKVKNFYKILLSVLDVGLSLMDSNDEIIYSNSTIKKLLGCESNEVFSKIQQLIQHNSVNNEKHQNFQLDFSPIRHHQKEAKNQMLNQQKFHAQKEYDEERMIRMFWNQKEDKNIELCKSLLIPATNNVATKSDSRDKGQFTQENHDIDLQKVESPNHKQRSILENLEKKLASDRELNINEQQLDQSRSQQIDIRFNKKLNNSHLSQSIAPNKYRKQIEKSINNINLVKDEERVYIVEVRNEQILRIKFNLIEKSQQNLGGTTQNIRNQNSGVDSNSSPVQNSTFNPKDYFFLISVEDYTETFQTKRLELKSKQTEQMISSLSHHLRSPLNCSIGLLEKAVEISEGTLKKKFINPSLNSNKLLLNNVNNFLDLSLIEIGGFEYEIQQVDLSSLIDEIANILNVQFQFQRVGLQVNLKPELSIIWTDKQRLTQIMLNLLLNSIQFSYQRGADITVQVSHQKQMQYQQDKSGRSENVFRRSESLLNSIKEVAQESIQQYLNICITDFGCGASQTKLREIENRLAQISNANQGFVGNSNEILRNLNENSKKNPPSNHSEEQKINPEEKLAVNISGNPLLDSNQKKLRNYEMGLQASASIIQGLVPLFRSEMPFKITSVEKQGFKISFDLLDFSHSIASDSDGMDSEIGSPWFSNQKFYRDSKEQRRSKNLKQGSQGVHNEKIEISNQSNDSSVVGLLDSLEDRIIQDENVLFESCELPLKPHERSIFAQPKDYISGQKQIQPETHVCFKNQILIVDDLQFNILSIQNMLEENQIESDFCFNGQEAIDKVKQRHSQACGKCSQYYQIILMDIDMPVKDGYAATCEILHFLQDSSYQTQIIACTAYFSSSDIDYAKQIGIKDYIPKPLNQQLVDNLLHNQGISQN